MEVVTIHIIENNEIVNITINESLPQLQPDFNQTNEEALDYINNKPTIPTALSDLSEDSTHRLCTDTEKSSYAGKQDALGFTPEVSGTAAQAKSDLLDNVATNGNTLKKLYTLILGSFSEAQVATIAERDAYEVVSGNNIFVTNDGDGKWALYKATSHGINATYVKLSDPDLLNAVMSNSQIKTAYESNSDTNAFTNALLTKLDALDSSAYEATGTASTIIGTHESTYNHAKIEHRTKFILINNFLKF